ncbi:MAG: hypothetical protein OXB92_08880 [Acidimicrobiaceae bacterium]|nr:hypothetical protein [Acidimicrobiaceae bacterium]
MARSTGQKQIIEIVSKIDVQVVLTSRRSQAWRAPHDVGTFAQIDRLPRELGSEQLGVAERAAPSASDKQLAGCGL